MRRGWVALLGLVIAAAAIYVVLTGVSVGSHEESDREIGERSRQDLRDLLRETEEAG